MFKNKTFWLLLLLCAISLSANIWGYSIYLLDEAKNASCAREMLESENWVVPTFNYQLREDKPPLHYYFMALSYSFFGVNEFAARFFSVVFGCLTMLCIYFVSAISLGRKAAKYAVLTLISSLGFIVQFHLAVPDPYLVFFFTASLLSFYKSIEVSEDRWMYLSHLFIGLGIMTKGPIGLLPLLIMVILKFKWSLSWKGLRILHGTLIIMLAALPWYVLVTVQTDGEWLRLFLLDHNINRFLDVREGHGGMFFLTPIYFLVMSLPLGIFLIPAVWWYKNHQGNRFVDLSLVTLIVILVFFSISATKLPNYVSPALPFGSIIAGYYLATGYRLNLSTIIPLIFYFIIGLSIPLFVQYGLEKEGFEPMTSYLFIIPLGAGLGLLFLWRSRLDLGFWSIALSSILTITLAFFLIVPSIDGHNPVKNSVHLIDKQRTVASFHIFNPSYSFYLKREIPVFTDPHVLDLYLSNGGIVITRPHVLDELKTLKLDSIYSGRDLFDGTTTTVLRKVSTRSDR